VHLERQGEGVSTQRRLERSPPLDEEHGALLAAFEEIEGVELEGTAHAVEIGVKDGEARVVAVHEGKRRARHALRFGDAEGAEKGPGKEGLPRAERTVEQHEIARRHVGREGARETARVASTAELEVRAHARTVRVECGRVRPISVGVIGCGTAGPAAALFLAEQGHEVTIYERVANPTAVGAGIILQPTGQAVLARLGVYAPVKEKGAHLDGLIVKREGQRTLLELSYATVSADYYGLGLHRGVLFEALFEAVKRHPKITLRLGVTGEGLVRGPGGAFFVATDGGEQLGPHDLVIAADGARSRFRDDTGLLRRAEPYPWGAVWFMADDPDHHFQGKLFQFVEGTRKMLGFLPTGRGPELDGTGDRENKVSLYWSLAADEVAALRRPGGFERWRDEVRAMSDDADRVLSQIGSAEELLFSQYVVMAPWHTRAVVHLGDSAHATSPQLGQGANLALWDAMVLADAVAAEPTDLVRALSAYSRARQSHLDYYQFATRALTPFFQSRHDALGVLRDLFMPLAGKIPFFNRAMVLGMTGTCAGFTFGELQLPRD
jgi:2-polyprenyl-6-methoxyphenol hydroxylase-like FAD-dependent oxidoreductase